jgi:DNA polymerase-4
MPSTVARRLCPDAVFVEGRYHRYVEVSGELHAILREVTPLIEGISLDEAFLDVTGCRQRLGDGPTIAALIRRRVGEELHLECSVGVGRTKFMAKLASKAAKPRADRSGIRPGPGVVEVPADEELAFLHPLPVRALWGVGPATGQRLERLGVHTIGDIAALPPGTLERTLGPAVGAHLAALARAEDPRPVVPEQAAKSIGHEETFATDLWDPPVLHRHLGRMADASATALRNAGLTARTVTVKVRFADFSLVTRSHTLDQPIDGSRAVTAVADALLDTVGTDQAVRLLGVSLSGFGSPDHGVQLSWAFESSAPESPESPESPGRGPVATGGGKDDPLAGVDRDVEHLQRSWAPVTAAVDAIRERYGSSSVGPASLVGPDGLRIRRRGEAQWGPAGPGTGGPAPSGGSPGAPGRE